MIDTRRTIVVRNLEISLSIGIHRHEKAAPQRFLVSVELELDTGPAGASDSIRSTVDYDAICDFIRGLQNEPHIQLQETVAQRVLEFVLSIPGVAAATVETRKPDVFDDCEYVGVTITALKS